MATPTQQPPSLRNSILDESYDEILYPILDEKSALGAIGTLIGFLGRKSDLFEDENVESKIIGLLSDARKGFGNRKKKAEERGLEDVNMRLNEADEVMEKEDEFETPGGERGKREAMATEKCDICLGPHDRSKCQFLFLVPVPVKKEKEDRYIPKRACAYCDERHETTECKRYFEIKNKKWVSSSDDDDDGSIPSLELSESDYYEAQVPLPKECYICCREHDAFEVCSYINSVPPNAKVGPLFEVRCFTCHGDLDSTMDCPTCGRVESGYLTSKHCDRCCETILRCTCAAPSSS